MWSRLPFRLLVSGLPIIGLLFGGAGLRSEPERIEAVQAELAIATGATRRPSDEIRSILAARSDECRREFRRADTAISLADLAAIDASEERDAMRKAATSAIRRQLSCSPRDANAWFLLAVAADPAADAGAILDYVNMSARYAPLEGWILVRRVRFLCSTSGLDIAGVSEAVQRDFRALLNDGQFAEAISIYDNCRNGAERGLADALKSVSSKTREEFARAIARNAAKPRS